MSYLTQMMAPYRPELSLCGSRNGNSRGPDLCVYPEIHGYTRELLGPLSCGV